MSSDDAAPIPLILDVDTGVDDAMALMLATRHRRADLRAVTCVAGNAALDQVVANTLYVLDAAGAGDVPVGRGAARPLLAAPHDAGHVHGDDGLCGFSRPSDRRAGELSAMELLRRTLMTAVAEGERVVLVPLAPLTNIALLLRAYPEVAAGIEKIVLMGGSATSGNATATAEFNVWHDPEAAAIVFAACGELDISLTMYGLDVFYDVRVGAADALHLRGLPDAAAQLAGSLIDAHRATFDSEDASIGDAGAVCAALDPAGITTQRFPVRVDTAPGYGRGQTIVDRRDWHGDVQADPHGVPSADVDVALAVDAARYRRLWLSIFED